MSVDYKVKYAGQLQAIKDYYATFAAPYNGEDNNDYVDGKGFCCNDGNLEAAQARALSRAAKNNFQEGDSYEKMQFYYHPDHLGSSSYITNLEGEVVQHIEYVPFGEVFVEERNNIWNTPYLFNAKEFDEETGLYYYGARYYDPRLSLWISVDPLAEKYPALSSFCFSANNPVTYIDPDGKAIVKGVVAAFKYAKRIWKIYKKTGRLTPANLKKAGLSEFLDIAGDVQTIFAGDASIIDKLSATTDLIVGTDFNNKGQKKVLKFIDDIKGKTKPYAKSRPSYGKGQIEKVWNSAKQPNNKVYNPYTGEELNWNLDGSRTWDMGHKPGKEYRKLHEDYMNGNISKEKFLEEYRNPSNYQPQSRRTNRSHKYERK